MTQTESQTLATSLSGFANEPATIIAARDVLLAKRGLVEMLYLRGKLAMERLARGRYQASLRMELTDKDGLKNKATAELTELVEAFAPQLAAFEAALNDFDSLAAAQQASPAGVTLIGAELEDHVKRLAELKKQNGAWVETLTERRFS